MLSQEFIAGYFSAIGSFIMVKHGTRQVPVFQIKTTIDNAPLLEQIRNTLEIKNRVYRYEHGNQKYALLIIRDRYTLQTKLVPFIEGHLVGAKLDQFNQWKMIFEASTNNWQFKNISSTVN